MVYKGIGQIKTESRAGGETEGRIECGASRAGHGSAEQDRTEDRTRQGGADRGRSD